MYRPGAQPGWGGRGAPHWQAGDEAGQADSEACQGALLLPRRPKLFFLVALPLIGITQNGSRRPAPCGYHRTRTHSPAPGTVRSHPASGRAVPSARDAQAHGACSVRSTRGACSRPSPASVQLATNGHTQTRGRCHGRNGGHTLPPQHQPALQDARQVHIVRLCVSGACCLCMLVRESGMQYLARGDRINL
jgi:hypothetical protein